VVPAYAAIARGSIVQTDEPNGKVRTANRQASQPHGFSGF
jgi:hypothetical protein